jgi:hypothetical protein
MSNLTKKDVHRATIQTRDMLKRNADPCETFEGVLNRGYVRALRTLVRLGEQFLVARKPDRHTVR